LLLDTDELRRKRFMARFRREGPPHQWGKKGEKDDTTWPTIETDW
jgi:hypothetical protein